MNRRHDALDRYTKRAARLALRVAARAGDREDIAAEAMGWVEATTGMKPLLLDYPPRHLQPRYGYGRPPHERIRMILARGEDTYRRNLETLASYRDDLLRVAPTAEGDAEPQWLSPWLLGLDAAAIYGFLRSRAPSRYVEIGSGESTLWARRAVQDGGHPTEIVSIDPEPRREVERLCDRSVREPLEAVDLALFDDVQEGDVLFMDGSHRVLTNSDATVFFLDVLPSLPSGVLVGVHDVLLPDDYLPMWTDWYWSEQYLMAAWLLAEGDKIRLELASHYVTAHSDLHAVLDPLWDALGLEGLARDGFALWFETSGR